MANPQVAQFRNITLTQGSADAFVQGTEPTGIDPAHGIGWELTRIELFFANTVTLEALSADNSVAWSLTRDSETAVMSLDDADCLHANGFAVPLTTSGEVFVPRLYVWTPPPGLVIVSPNLYAQLDSTGTGLTLVATMRVYYESVKLSELEVLRMLSQG